LDRNAGAVIILVGLLPGIAGLYLFYSFGPYTNGGLLGEACLLISGVLFVIGIIIFAIARWAFPHLSQIERSDRPPP